MKLGNIKVTKSHAIARLQHGLDFGVSYPCCCGGDVFFFFKNFIVKTSSNLNSPQRIC